MTEYHVTGVRRQGPLLLIAMAEAGGTDPVRELHIPAEAVEVRMSEYGLPDAAAALDVVLHEMLWTEYAGTLDPRDDPALVAGWVTDAGPDAVPIGLYMARSGADAAGAHAARLDATKAAYASVADPAGVLEPEAARPLDQKLLRHHRARTDVARWENVYGELPVYPDATEGRAPIQMRG